MAAALKMKIVGAMILAGAASTGQAVELFNNGPVVASGVSILTAPATTLGIGSNTSVTVADNFTVTGNGWNVTSVDFYGYQTGAVGFTFTGVTYSIVSGTNVNTGLVLASGTLGVTNDGMVGYRASSATPTDTTRAIYKIGADIPDITLAAGSYFLTWALTGSAASGPFVPPVIGSLGTGNALQAPIGTGVYAALTDAGSLQSLDLPFTITGTVVAVPEPTTTALMLIGALAVGGMVRRRKGAAQA